MFGCVVEVSMKRWYLLEYAQLGASGQTTCRAEGRGLKYGSPVQWVVGVGAGAAVSLQDVQDVQDVQMQHAPQVSAMAALASC
jgi:hypothetical protein